MDMAEQVALFSNLGPLNMLRIWQTHQYAHDILYGERRFFLQVLLVKRACWILIRQVQEKSTKCSWMSPDESEALKGKNPTNIIFTAAV